MEEGFLIGFKMRRSKCHIFTSQMRLPIFCDASSSNKDNTYCLEKKFHCGIINARGGSQSLSNFRWMSSDNTCFDVKYLGLPLRTHSRSPPMLNRIKRI